MTLRDPRAWPLGWQHSRRLAQRVDNARREHRIPSLHDAGPQARLAAAGACGGELISSQSWFFGSMPCDHHDACIDCCRWLDVGPTASAGPLLQDGVCSHCFAELWLPWCCMMVAAPNPGWALLQTATSQPLEMASASAWASRIPNCPLTPTFGDGVV